MEKSLHKQIQKGFAILFGRDDQVANHLLRIGYPSASFTTGDFSGDDWEPERLFGGVPLVYRKVNKWLAYLRSRLATDCSTSLVLVSS